MRRAILIASAKFDPDSGIEPLRFPENDVAALKSLFQLDDFKFDSITTIIDRPKHFIEKKLDEVLSETALDDFLLIYFSGHGKLNSRGDLFLSCSNTNRKTLNVTGLKYSHLMEMLDAHDAERVAILLDCCYAGRAVKGLKGSISEQVDAQLDSGRGIYILGASGATQTAQERELDGHGIFTRQVIEGLKTGSADIDNDGRISLNDLAQYVRAEFRRKKIAQDPFMAGLAKSGDLILGANRKVSHARTVTAIRLKIEQTKAHFTKATYRSIEDYLDRISERPDTARDNQFVALMAFEAGASIEDVIVTFRPEPSDHPRTILLDKSAKLEGPAPPPHKPEVKRTALNPLDIADAHLFRFVSLLMLWWAMYYGRLMLPGAFRIFSYPLTFQSYPVIGQVETVSRLIVYPLTMVLAVATFLRYKWARSLGRVLVPFSLVYISIILVEFSNTVIFIGSGVLVWSLAGWLYFIPRRIIDQKGR